MFEQLSLIDHHCHGVVRRDLSLTALESHLTEAAVGSFASRIGLAVRRWCAPVLDLPAHAPAEDYVDRRTALGFDEVNARFLGAAGLHALCVDTGYTPEPILSPAELGALAGGPAYEIVRLEEVAESLHGAVTAGGFPDAFRSLLDTRCTAAVGVKSIAAYRVGLGLAAERPADTEVVTAAAHWLAGPARLADPVLQRFLIWCGADLGLPVQFHVGLGDADVDMRSCDPLLLTGLIRNLRVPVMLLHNYPFHREAGYLAQVFDNVYVDVGLATHNLGDRATVLVEETLELAPFTKLLFSSDAFGLPEFYHLSAVLFRRGLASVLGSGVSEGSWTAADADRLAELVAVENATRAYGL
ncbi:amidohydrolase family protein [Actinocrispum wychmicini]|uniref:Amidohydrolase-related domain-containing protein n=1 Tax=Actinocrispum wychmicini TaxID=1213861 RepID=A0A4R2K0L5_9PSEU|nr:amidohydrolase family protein [Actinocrispum wychmicini]TCO65824.1 hypothetical protein EV192_1011616 [Actinocrispum wychmicini]